MIFLLRRLGVLLPFFYLFSAPAFAQEALLTREVSVDVSEADAAASREKALKDAEMKGFSEFLDILSPAQKGEILKKTDPKQVSALIRGVEVVNEQIIGNRYRAQLRINYAADGLNALVAEKSAEAKEAPIRSTARLVLPVMKDGDTLKLFDPGNAWREAWEKVALETPKGGVILAYGDQNDISLVDGASALSADFKALKPLAARYGTGEIVVLGLRPYTTPETKVDIVKRRLSANMNEVSVLGYYPDTGEKSADFYTRVARDVAEQLGFERETQVKTEAKAMQKGEEIKIIATYTTLRTWTEVRKRLLDIPFVNGLEVQAISPEQVDMMVHYRGSREALAQAVATKGLKLQPMDDYWVVSRN